MCRLRKIQEARFMSIAQSGSDCLYRGLSKEEVLSIRCFRLLCTTQRSKRKKRMLLDNPIAIKQLANLPSSSRSRVEVLSLGDIIIVQCAFNQQAWAGSVSCATGPATSQSFKLSVVRCAIQCSKGLGGSDQRAFHHQDCEQTTDARPHAPGRLKEAVGPWSCLSIAPNSGSALSDQG